MKPALFFLSACLCINSAHGQKLQEQTVDLQKLTDELVGFPDEDADYEDLYENLAQILSSPRDLNSVSRAELQQLHILTDNQIDNILAYRKQHGNFLDIYELQAVPGLDLTLISGLAPFVKVTDPRNRVDNRFLRRLFSGGHSYFITRYARTLETKKGFRRNGGNPAAYRGTPGNLYWRARNAIPGDFSIGVTAEKDAGESLTFRPETRQWGFDFTSWHLQLQNKGKLKNLIIGDFQTQFAQGLLLGGAFGLGKGAESVSTTRKSNLGFLPYTSINENAYQRGIAVTLQPFEHIAISSFYGRTRRDASFADVSDTLSVTSFQQTGYHRTETELQKRKKVLEQNAGLIVHFQKNNFDAGCVLHAIHYNVSVERKPTLYNQHAFRGRRNLNTGVFLNWTVGNLSFFSEAGKSASAGGAVIGGLLISVHRNLDISIVYRKYARDFHTFYSNALSENTAAQNERGVYWGWKYRWNRQYSFSGYLDLFTFPWLGFRRYAPSEGYEWLLRANYQPSKKVSVFIRFRGELKYRNIAEPRNVYQLEPGNKRNVTLNCDYGIDENIRLKTRIQYNNQSFHKKMTQGIALIQDISFSAGRFKFTGRHALFDTNHYDNRHYVYEHDAWLAYSLPAYSGVGVRNYALIEYTVNKQLTIWVRYARTWITQGEEIGSGHDVIAGNTKNDVKFQARIKF